MRPIDADALLNDPIFRSVRRVDEIDEIGESVSYLAVPVECIEKAPTLDYAPVVHGEWGEYESPYGFPSLSGFPCSVCGMHQTDIRGLYYCPNCGANMMDGGKKDENA